MDGVRRPGRGGGTIVLQTTVPRVVAAVVPLPQAWTHAGGSIDGLRRIAQSFAPETSAAITPEVLTPNRNFSPLALVSLAAVPMVAAAGVLGVRTALAHRSDTAAVTVTAKPASTPVAPVAAAASTQAQFIQNLLDSFGQSSTYSLYVQNLKTGELASTAPDRVFESASLYKLFVANLIYRQIDNGQLSYASPAGGGTGSTVGSCLNLMITISDNGCGRALGSLIGWSNLTQATQAQGYAHTDLVGSILRTTPRDVALLFQRLYAGSLLSSDSSSQFLSLLKSQRVNNRLPQGLPAGTSFAHKTGDLDGYLHDAGIVYGPKTDYLVVMMGAPGAQPNDFATLNQQLYSFFNN